MDNMDIEHIIKNASFEELQEATSFRENQLYWIDYIVSSIEKRRVAEILFSKGYTIKKVENVLVLGDGEAALIKKHLDQYGIIDSQSILKILTKIYRRATLVMVIEQMIDKKCDKDVIEDVISLLKE
ncbi:hypothetical protein F3157_03875 [Virgibacillus dakarensis]|nr:hypothetical protein [Virgibacillus dakarensis]